MASGSDKPWKKLKTSEVFVPNKNAVLFEKIRQSLAVVFGTDSVTEFENYVNATGGALSEHREAMTALLGPDMGTTLADDKKVKVEMKVKMEVKKEVSDVKPEPDWMAKPAANRVVEQYKRCNFVPLYKRCQYVDRSNNMAKHWMKAHKQPMPTGDGNGWTHVYLTAEEFDKKMKAWKVFSKSLSKSSIN